MKTNNPSKTNHSLPPIISNITVALLILATTIIYSQSANAQQPWKTGGSKITGNTSNKHGTTSDSDPGKKDLIIISGGAEKMRVKENGTVRIGNPNSTDVAKIKFKNANSQNGGMTVGISSGNANGNKGYVKLKEAKSLSFYTGNTEQFSISAGGELKATVFSGNGTGLLQYDNSGVFTHLPFTQSVQDVLRGDGSWGSYFDDDWKIVGNDMYTIPTGNVGIGIIPTIYKLDVAGNVHVGGSVFADDMLVSGKIKGGRIETDTVSTGRMMVDTSVKVANSIFIDGVTDRIWASSGNIDFMSTNLSTTGTITAGALNVSSTTFDSLKVLNRIVTSRITSPDSALLIGDSSLIIVPATNTIYSTSGIIHFSGLALPALPGGPAVNLPTMIARIRAGNQPGNVSMWDFSTNSNDKKLQLRSPITNKTVMTLTDTGSVGIGTVTPSRKLDVKGNIQLGNHLIYNSPGDPNGFINWPNAGSIWFRSTTNPGDINGYTTRMLITGSGNVGIGSSSPMAALQIKRNAGVLNLEGADHAYIQWYPDGWGAGRKAWTGFGSAEDNNFYVSNEIANAHVILRPGTGGNVGVGTSSPNHKLDVCGTIRSKKVLVETFGCDFVFEDDYQRKTPLEKEKYLKEEKHLFGVDSAKEIEENGFDVGKNASGIILNVEENALDIIDLYKMYKELKNENAELKQRIIMLENK